MDYLLPAGCDFNNTVMRVRPFPFVWGMKLGKEDKRTKLNEGGAATLFLKEVTYHGRLVTCAAFRTGSGNISAIVLTTLHDHQWEGICLHAQQRALYQKDPAHGLDEFIFEKLATNNFLYKEKKHQINSMLEDLRENSIDILTLEQGPANWHMGR